MKNINELIYNMSEAPEKFNHLKIFLHREHTHLDSKFGRRFLFVSPDSFGQVILKDLLTEGNSIILVLEDTFSGQLGSFTIDINDKSIKFLLIAWEDVLDTVVHEKNSRNKSDELPEFDFH